jgi:tRNA pseudouridine55 synthase
MFGFISLNKPVGFTSHDCVAKMRRLLNTRKIGHGGTLDPAAIGVLPIAVGKATRLLQFLPQNKAYRARIRFGVTTNTDDLAGEIIHTASKVNLNKEQIIDSLPNFLGAIAQVPPMYSAIKRDGRKLYELARKGETIEVPSRTVEIYKLELLNYFPGDFPEIEVDIDCSAGTYIRAIARDLGAMLAVGGTLANLIRTQSCGLTLDNSLTFEQLTARLANKEFELISPKLLLNHLPLIKLVEPEAIRWCQGQKINLPTVILREEVRLFLDRYIATYREDNTFLGISTLIDNGSDFQLKPKIVCI